MPISNYPKGFSTGITIKELPILNLQNGDGNVFWVDSNKGSDGNKGNFIYPFATIDYAIGRCTAGQGDKVIVAAGHTETIIAAGGITANVAAIQIIGMGTKENRPVLTFTTDVDATFLVSAADVYIGNIVFKCSIDSQVAMLDLNAERTIIETCRFETDAGSGLVMADVNGGGANACDGVKFVGCDFYAPAAGNWAAAIELGEVADNVKIEDCILYGDFDDACIHNPTGKVLTNLYIINCAVGNLQAGDWAIELVSNCTGLALDLRLYADTAATTFLSGYLKCLNCSAVNGNGVGSYEIPAPLATTEIFWITKAVVSSTIVVATPTDITTAATGNLWIEDVLVATDTTGLAGGTNFILKSDDAVSDPQILVETVSNLGASQLVDLDNASVRGVRYSLASTLKLQVQCTGSDCTGSGEIVIIVKFRRMAQGADIVIT